jgi:hypothetical protein
VITLQNAGPNENRMMFLVISLLHISWPRNCVELTDDQKLSQSCSDPITYPGAAVFSGYQNQGQTRTPVIGVVLHVHTY